MTITKREILKALAPADDDAVIYIDDGIDCKELRDATFIENAFLREDVSSKHNASLVEDGSIVLRLA